MNDREMPLTPDEQQARWLQDASNSVKHNAFLMKRALDESNLRAALKHSSAMLNELRTGSLNPKTYYGLYITVCDELRYLEVFFADENKGGRPNRELYESVQHAGNVLPRLYLLFTVGSVYIKSKEAPAKDVLKDMVEMAKGVQHPTRGLFMRAYLLQVAKDKLPDAGNEYEKQSEESGGTKDSVDFIIQNFTEMNKLWVRMQHQGAAADKIKREKERRELGLLVGMNLISLSQLDGMDKLMYSDEVLPRILEQLVNCKDQIAQQYLLDAIIQVFPDEFHLETLDALLKTLPQLQPTVKVHQSLSSLISRLAAYAGPTERGVLDATNAYSKLAEAVQSLAGKFTGLSVADRASMFSALLAFAMKLYPGDLDYVNGIFGSCVAVFGEGEPVTDPAAVTELVNLLNVPVEAGEDLIRLASLENARTLMDAINLDTRRELAAGFARKILDAEIPLDTPEKVSDVLSLLKLLFSGDVPSDKDDFMEEQNLAARILVLIGSGVDDMEGTFAVLKETMPFVEKSGAKRLPYTCPPMVFNILKLLRSVNTSSTDEFASPSEEGGEEPEQGESGKKKKKAKTASKKLLLMANTCLQKLASVPGDKATLLRLYLSCASVADECKQEENAYKFIEEAITTYEDEISDSREQVASLYLLIASISTCMNFSTDLREPLVHKATVLCSRLLRKDEQCRASCACSHLFWGNTEEEQDGDAVMKCLRRAVKNAKAFQDIASASEDDSGKAVAAAFTTKALYVEILNKYIFFFDAGCSAVTSTVLQGLIEVVKEEMTDCDLSQHRELEAFYTNTLRHISSQKTNEESAARYAEIQA